MNSSPFVDWFDGLVFREEGCAEAVAYLSKFAWLLSQGEELTDNTTFQAATIIMKKGPLEALKADKQWATNDAFETRLW
jgi:hypothetical protein